MEMRSCPECSLAVSILKPVAGGETLKSSDVIDNEAGSLPSRSQSGWIRCNQWRHIRSYLVREGQMNSDEGIN